MADSLPPSRLHRHPGLVLITVVGVAALLCGLAGELYLRWKFHDPSQLSARLVYDHRLNTVHYQEQFLSQYNPTAQWRDNVHDPELGWDINRDGGRVRGETLPRDFRWQPGLLWRVAVVGDSFTFGSEVAAEQAYPARLQAVLERDGPARVLNMGVSGYGSDQILLKALHYALPLVPDLLVIGVHTPNYERASVGFFSYFKPDWAVDANGAVRRIDPPIPAPDEGFARVRAAVSPVSWLWNHFTYTRRRDKLKQDAAAQAAYYQRTDAIIAHLLGQVAPRAQASGVRLLVVQIPLGNVFHDPQRLQQARSDPEYTHALALYRRWGLEVVDLLEALPATHALTEIHQRLYLPRAGAVVRGHFSPAGNQVVAELIAEHLRTPPADAPSRR